MAHRGDPKLLELDEHVRVEREVKLADLSCHAGSSAEQRLDAMLAALGRGERGTRVVFRGPDDSVVAVSETQAQAWQHKPGWVCIGTVGGSRSQRVTLRHVDGRTMEMSADRAAMFRKPGWSRADGAPRTTLVEIKMLEGVSPGEEPAYRGYVPSHDDRTLTDHVADEIDREEAAQRCEQARRRRLAKIFKE